MRNGRRSKDTADRTLTVLIGQLYDLAMGGGPFLLIVSVASYLLASWWLLLAEWCYFRWVVPGAGRLETFEFVARAKLRCFLVSGIAFPSILALVSLTGAFVPGTIGDIVLAGGSWVSEGFALNALAGPVALFWLMCGFFLCVWLESKSLARITILSPEQDLSRHVWRVNAISYPGVIIAAIAVMYDVL